MPATARRCICMCQCEQADDRDGSCLCSMATGAPAPWCPTAGPSRRSQRRARSLYLHHFEFKTTAGEESVESSPATVRHQAACASVSKRTMEAACAPWPLAFLPQGVPLRGPPVARSVVPGLCIFAIIVLHEFLDHVLIVSLTFLKYYISVHISTIGTC